MRAGRIGRAESASRTGRDVGVRAAPAIVEQVRRVGGLGRMRGLRQVGQVGQVRQVGQVGQVRQVRRVGVRAAPAEMWDG